MNTTIDIIIKAFETWTLLLTKANQSRCWGYQTARVYAIQADHPPALTPMTSPPRNVPMGPVYYWLGPNYQQYPWQWFGPCINCDKPGRIHMVCPDVHTDQEICKLCHNECGRLCFGRKRGNRGMISGYRAGRRFLSMLKSAPKVARQGQQGGGVASTAAPHQPQLQHIARSQLFQRASAQVTALRLGITQQPSEINGYYSARSTGKIYKDEGNEDHIEELSDEGELEDEGQGDSSAEEQKESETEEERDAHLNEEEREKKSWQSYAPRQNVPLWTRHRRWWTW